MNKMIDTFIELLLFLFFIFHSYITFQILQIQILHLGIVIELTVLQKYQAALLLYL